MSQTLETNYRGATLALDIGASPSVTLRINGLVRDRAASADETANIRVSSTVQTDYEWHEFIEGVVQYDEGRILARLIANNQELASQEFGRKVTP